MLNFYRISVIFLVYFKGFILFFNIFIMHLLIFLITIYSQYNVCLFFIKLISNILQYFIIFMNIYEFVKYLILLKIFIIFFKDSIKSNFSAFLSSNYFLNLNFILISIFI
jgi:hypothetical protein